MIKSWLLAAGAMFTAACIVSPWYLIGETTFFLWTVLLAVCLYVRRWLTW